MITAIADVLRHNGGLATTAQLLTVITRQQLDVQVANGGLVRVNTVFDGDASASGRLVVTGDTSGNGQIQTVKVGGSGAPTVEGIKVIDVQGASNANFTLLGDYSFRGDQAVVAGAYAYRLYKNGVSKPTDGDWYLRAYDYFGHKVGSKENEEGQIFIESQGWCTMAGIGLEEGMVKKALDSVKERLDCEHGIVLNNPPFTRYVVEYGEISTYPAGYKENAGIFCHNNPWVIIGETVLGRGDRSWEYFRKICPSYTEEHSALHKVEPYVCCQMVAGKDAARPGEGKNSWLTGTAAWMWYAITQFILGIKPSYEGLEINPCIPAGWKGFNVKRRFRGAEYHITVKNPDGVCKGIKSVTVDGQPIEGNVVNHLPGTHTVEVIMG